ncbi:hypothetical protein [Methylomonas sp. Kb3]|uniref:hypothetical protein n=1 Tax=Methylomonas sp. Kb3 TaxID=1611544 RepID=UPI0013FD8F29|nr:hypothetical protein [Methylomonas sp. Kb3]
MDTPVVVMANRSDWLDDGTRAEALLVVIQTFNSKFSKPPQAAVPSTICANG